MIRINDFIEILRLTEEELYEYLKHRNRNAHIGKNYILYFYDKKYPTLVSHIDTVHKEKPKHLLFNDFLMWSPEGIGGDDRCGVYICLEMWQNLKVNILFTNGEERGGIGAYEACECELLTDTPYFIELDRKGTDAVFYNDELLSRNKLVKVFTSVVKDYYSIGTGTFSDISILGEYFEVASVNLGVGFHREHTFAEYINLREMRATMEKLPHLIKDINEATNHKKIKHRASLYSFKYDKYYHRCWNCTLLNCYTCQYNQNRWDY